MFLICLNFELMVNHIIQLVSKHRFKAFTPDIIVSVYQLVSLSVSTSLKMLNVKGGVRVTEYVVIVQRLAV